MAKITIDIPSNSVLETEAKKAALEQIAKCSVNVHTKLQKMAKSEKGESLLNKYWPIINAKL